MSPQESIPATKAPAKERSGGVQSIERVFGLLEALANAGGEASLRELADSSGLPIPSIHRLIRTMVTLGYVRQLPSRRYALGARFIRLGELAGRQIGAVAQPNLHDVVKELGETSNIAILDGDGCVYLAQSPSPHAMRMFTEVGHRVPLHCTGVGKVMLAGMADAEIDAVMARTGMAAVTHRTHTSLPSLMADVERIRSRGYSIDDEEQEVGVRCYAVPIPDAPTVMALSVSGPVARVDLSFGDRAVPVLQRTAQRISDAFRADDPTSA